MAEVFPLGKEIMAGKDWPWVGELDPHEAPSFLRPEGAWIRQPRATPWDPSNPIQFSALKGRNSKI